MTTYSALPPGRHPRYLVPRENRRAASRAFALFTAGNEGVNARITRTALRLGLARALPAVPAEEVASVATAMEVAGLSGCPVIHLGPPRANRKPVALVMQKAEAGSVLKVGTGPLTDALIRAECGALESLQGALPPGIVIPRLQSSGTTPRSTYSAQSVLPGATDPASRHLTDPEAAAIARAIAGDGERSPWAGSNWSRHLELQVEQLPPGPDSDLVAQAFARWISIAKGDAAFGRSHGDFSPWNSLWTPVGVEIWDWERYAVDAPIGVDIVHWHVQRCITRSASILSAVTDGTRRAEIPLRQWGMTREEVRVVIDSYLVSMAARSVTDRQREHGRPIGRVDEWLLQTMESGRGRTGG